MTNDKFKPVQNTPKTYEQFILEEQQLTPEQQQDLYPDLVHEDISASKGYGPCLDSYCYCSLSKLQSDKAIIEERIRAKQTFQSFSVEVVNSSGRGWNGGGRCVVHFGSESQARSFCSQVRGRWVSEGGNWSPNSSSGIGNITSNKRERIAKAVEARIASGGGGHISDSQI